MKQVKKRCVGQREKVIYYITSTDRKADRFKITEMHNTAEILTVMKP